MRLRALATAAAIALTALPAYAHFGVLMPGSELVNRPKTPLELTLAFCHPVEQNGMNLDELIISSVVELVDKGIREAQGFFSALKITYFEFLVETEYRV